MDNDAVLAQVIGDAFRTVCDDDVWQILGFKRRPRGGLLLQPLRRRWKVELENTALREMISLVVAAYVAADVLTADSVHAVAVFCTSTPQLSRALGYQSQETGQAHLCQSLQAYIGEPPDRWPALLLRRIDADRVPDRQLAARLFVGCPRFAALAQDFARRIQK